jgi:replicative DNA helicase Mcm
LDRITSIAAIDSEFLKKYIAYGRTRVFPVLTENAIKVIQKFFIGLRQKSQGGRVTVTFRQLEALVRLAEASAKIRLSENVTEEDANRGINLYKKSMEQVGLDPETGTFDIDIIATGQSHNQTSRMMKIVEIINNLVKEQNGQAAKYEHIVQEAEKDGLDKPKVKELIDKLLKVGDIYEPRAYCYMATKKD